MSNIFNIIYKILFDAHKSLKDTTYVILDIETTGLDPSQSEIIEIAAIKCQKEKIIDIFETLVNPNCYIPPKITTLTGISNQMLTQKPSPKIALLSLLNFISNSVLVAHNTDFDIKFLQYHTKKYLNKNFSNKTVCTFKVAKYLFPKLSNHKLHSVAKHLNINISNRHRALGDAKITFNIWYEMIKLLNQKNISTLKELEKELIKLNNEKYNKIIKTN